MPVVTLDKAPIRITRKSAKRIVAITQRLAAKHDAKYGLRILDEVKRMVLAGYDDGVITMALTKCVVLKGEVSPNNAPKLVSCDQRTFVEFTKKGAGGFLVKDVVTSDACARLYLDDLGRIMARVTVERNTTRFECAI